MKSTLAALPLILAASMALAGASPVTTTTTTKTDPTLFLGLSWTFSPGVSSTGGMAGVTLKLLSTNKRNSGAVAAGVTYNFDGSFGCDLGLGYNSAGSATLTLGYDICKHAPQFGLGASGRAKTTTTTTTGPVSPPPA